MGGLFFLAVARDPGSERIRRRTLIAAIALTSALAWLALWRWGSSPAARYGHQHIHFAASSEQALFGAFVLGWTVMLVAMMLPTSIPLFTLFSRLTRSTAQRHLLLSLLIAGYLGAWIGAGILAYLAADLLNRAAHFAHWTHMHAQWLGVGSLLLAGVFQFTPLKHRCLEKCRSPFSFIAEHWTGEGNRKDAWWLGAHHGLFCIGCCWSLMLLMFTVGAGSVGWMLLLGSLMAIEKNAKWGKPFAKVLGVALLASGAFLALWPSAFLF